SLSPDLGSDSGGARPAAVTDPSSASGAHADASEEPTAAHCLEPGLAEEAQAVEGDRTGVVGQPEAGAVDTTAPGYVAGDAGGIGREDSASGSSGSQRSRSLRSRAAVGDASRSGASDFSGHGADDGRRTTVCRLTQLGQLSGVESVGGIQRTAPATGGDQQAREPISTISPGGRRG